MTSYFAIPALCNIDLPCHFLVGTVLLSIIPFLSSFRYVWLCKFFQASSLECSVHLALHSQTLLGNIACDNPWANNDNDRLEILPGRNDMDRHPFIERRKTLQFFPAGEVQQTNSMPATKVREPACQSSKKCHSVYEHALVKALKASCQVSFASREPPD